MASHFTNPSICHYKILGVEQDADIKTIKNAYRQLAKEYHPDRLNASATVADASHARGVFTAATEAHAILGNTQHRAAYDKYGPHAAASSLNNSWRNDAHYSGRGKPFWKVASRAWLPMLGLQGIITAGVLFVMSDTKSQRSSGQLAGLHADRACHSSEEIARRIVKRRTNINSTPPSTPPLPSG